MTLASAKETVLSLLGETALTRGGNLFTARLNRFLDMAQKEAALSVPVEKTVTATVSGGTYHLPSDVQTPLLLYKDNRNYGFTRLADTLCAEDGTYTLLYRAYPATLSESTPDSYVFEVPRSVQKALCYYAAALCILPEDITMYRNLMDLFEKAMTAGVTARVVTR